jgi:hypothetical protein
MTNKLDGKEDNDNKDDLQCDITENFWNKSFEDYSTTLNQSPSVNQPITKNSSKQLSNKPKEIILGTLPFPSLSPNYSIEGHLDMPNWDEIYNIGSNYFNNNEDVDLAKPYCDFFENNHYI